jgi:DNA polymerase III subunit chi
MPKVSFYVLPTQSDQERLIFACKLVEKAYRSSNRIYILTESDAQSRLMDNLLWTFRAGSFIPHHLYDGKIPTIENRILLGTLNAPEPWQKIIINLSGQQPADLEYSERIMEILDASATVKQAGRERYRHYKHLGLTISTHNMDQ